MLKNLSNFFDYYNNIPVLVTGGAGFIGSHLVDRLVKYKANVTILDNFSTGSYENIAHIADKITIINDTITTLSHLNDLCENTTIIFHLAAHVSVPESMKNPLACYECNIMDTAHLLEASVKAQVKKFFFASSAAVYGNQIQPCKEDATLFPTSPYGLSKAMGETLVRYYHNHTPLNCIIGRFFNVFGPRQKQGIWSIMHESFTSNKSMPIWGNGLQSRDFIPVEDVVTLIMFLMTGNERDLIFNIATGTSHTILEFFESQKKHYPHYTEHLISYPAREGDIFSSQADCSKLTKRINTAISQ